MTRQERSRQFRKALRTLTPRERQMLALRCGGQTNQAIANDAFVSYATVKNHVHNAVAKLDGVLDEVPRGAITQLDVVCFRLGYEVALRDMQKGVAELEDAA